MKSFSYVAPLRKESVVNMLEEALKHGMIGPGYAWYVGYEVSVLFWKYLNNDK